MRTPVQRRIVSMQQKNLKTSQETKVWDVNTVVRGLNYHTTALAPQMWSCLCSHSCHVVVCVLACGIFLHCHWAVTLWGQGLLCSQYVAWKISTNCGLKECLKKWRLSKCSSVSMKLCRVQGWSPSSGERAWQRAMNPAFSSNTWGKWNVRKEKTDIHWVDSRA